MRRRGSALAALALALAACGGGPPRGNRVCLAIQASPNLNLYDGQAHVVVLYLYPLENTLGFDRATVDDLLGSTTKLAGATGSRLELTVGPGQSLTFDETMPPLTSRVGVVADYYRAPGDPEGTRKAVVDAACGSFGKQKLSLSPRDLALE